MTIQDYLAHHYEAKHHFVYAVTSNGRAFIAQTPDPDCAKLIADLLNAWKQHPVKIWGRAKVIRPE